MDRSRPALRPTPPRAASPRAARGSASREASARGSDDSLNAAQREAVRTLSGPLLVLAGAGTGKTRVVTFRIAELIRHGVSPERILAVTFTNKAAREMLERCAALLGRQARAKPEISTFHSLCVRILRRNITRLGYPARFAIYDRGDQESLARSALREVRVPETALRPSDLLAIIGRWKNRSIRPAEAVAAAQSDREHLAASAYRRYQRALKLSGALDFDDLLLCTEELFERFADVRRAEAERFDHILVDEYQDTNGSQYRIIRALAAGHRNLCVVGDDDQSIYGWRGAEVTHILDFRRDWPDAKVVRLEENYRSTVPILEWANRLIAFNRRRHPKQLRSAVPGEPPRIVQLPDEAAEAKFVVEEIAARVRAPGRRPGDFAVLCRTNEGLRAFESELRAAKIPYHLVGGMSFFDRREVRDLTAYLRVAANPRDETAMLRIINTPPRGISPSVVARLLERAVRESRPFWDVVCDAGAAAALQPKSAEALGAFRAMIERHHELAQRRGPGEVLDAILDETAYRDDLARVYAKADDVESRLAAVEQFVNALADFTARTPRGTLTDFLQEIALADAEPDRSRADDVGRRDAVTLMTLHAAKGLEFPEVYLVGMEEGVLPHHRALDLDPSAIDEERRLCYVGVTRAQRRLTLCLPLARRKWGKPRPTRPSRFLYELTGQADNPNYRAVQRRKASAGPSRPDRARRSPPARREE